MRYTDYKHKSHQLKFANPINKAEEIYPLAVKLFDELWNGKSEINLIGLSISGLKDEKVKQKSIFNFL